MRRLDRIVWLALSTVLLSAFATGCTLRTVDRDENPGRTTSVLESVDDYDDMPIESSWPTECEVETIRIDRTIGLYYISNDADVEQELDEMNATLVENGRFREAIMACD